MSSPVCRVSAVARATVARVTEARARETGGLQETIFLLEFFFAFHTESRVSMSEHTLSSMIALPQ